MGQLVHPLRILYLAVGMPTDSGWELRERGSVRTEISRTRRLNLTRGQLKKLKMYRVKALKVLRKSAIIEGLVPITKSQGQRWSQERWRADHGESIWDR